MLPLFDMLAKAQEGNGMEALARQFGLSQQQAQQAVEALLPAFSQGLKQNTADPYGVGAFMTAMAGGQHAKYFDNPANAFSPSGVQEGNGILGHLFGSKELSRAVADQAAQATGIGQNVLKQMLPVIASMIMGGLAKQSNSQLQAGGFGSGGNPLGKILEGMFGGGAGQQAQPRGQPQQDQAQSPYGDNPLGKIFEQMMGGGGQAQTAPDAPADRPSGGAKNPYDDLFGKMFETGAIQRYDYLKGVESIFEQFTKGMDRHR
jgi:hypothetical protein